LVRRASVARGRSLGASFSIWDGAWYSRIAEAGYGFANSEGQTPYPFFPLLPWLLRAGEGLGLSPTATGVALTHLAFLLALWGVYDIARTHGTDGEAVLASWCLAFYPGTATLTLIYPDAIYLAVASGLSAPWRAVAWPSRQALAAAASTVRPNGIAPAAALTRPSPGRIRRRAARRFPGNRVCSGLMLRLWSETGDPPIFLHQAAWHEVTLASLLAG
jgi:hypothetical protein